MNNEIDTLVTMKYGKASISFEYIDTLPGPVNKRLMHHWPFVTEKEVHNILVSYELGKDIPDITF